MATITDANASFTISVPSVFPTPVPIEGFATDDAFDTDEVTPNEVKMGVDGILSGGHTPYEVPLKFMLQADSPSIIFMDQWRQAEDAANEAFIAEATIVAPGPGKIWTFTRGFLTKAKPTAHGQKTFGPQTYTITFNAVSAAPV